MNNFWENTASIVGTILNILSIGIYGYVFKSDAKYRPRCVITIILAGLLMGLYFSMDEKTKNVNSFYFAFSFIILINPIIFVPRG
jgi:FtsH-binding integral membrane protein